MSTGIRFLATTSARMKQVALCMLAMLFGLPALAQQDYVNRYDFFSGYSHLSAPSVSLEQSGFDATLGVNVNRWVALGGDFSVFRGEGAIHLADSKVAPLLAPFLNGQSPIIPFGATTITFAVGPQLNIRKWNKVTLFAHPDLGGIHEGASLQVPPTLAPLLSLIPGLTPQLSDTVLFYGAGGGFDYNASRHVGIRMSVDFVHTALFSSFLNSRNAVRVSVGPTWRWGAVK
jgi:hypothetical protein